MRFQTFWFFAFRFFALWFLEFRFLGFWFSAFLFLGFWFGDFRLLAFRLLELWFWVLCFWAGVLGRIGVTSFCLAGCGDDEFLAGVDPMAAVSELIALDNGL